MLCNVHRVVILLCCCTPQLLVLRRRLRRAQKYFKNKLEIVGAKTNETLYILIDFIIIWLVEKLELPRPPA